MSSYAINPLHANNGAYGRWDLNWEFKGLCKSCEEKPDNCITV
jgi:hypothetical protein